MGIPSQPPGKTCVDWRTLMQINAADLGSQHDISLLEAIIDSLLSDVTAEDQLSLSMHDYLHFMQLLQWALQCMWSLHSSAATLLTATTDACQATFAFNQALQQYVKAVHVDIRAFANGNISTAGPESEPLRIKLRPTKKAANSAYKQLQAAELSQQNDSLKFISHKLAVDWAALHAASLPKEGGQAASEVTLALLPMLAYGSLDEQDWRSLSSADCVHFIQLAQCGLQYLLQEVTSLHAKLRAAQQILRKRKLAGERLHQHCSACFRQLKQTSSRPACPVITEPSLALQVSHEQNPKVAAADAKSVMQMDMQPPSQRAAVQPQSRPVSPVRGSRVQYRASSDSPVQVQHTLSAPHSDAQAFQEQVLTQPQSAQVSEAGDIGVTAAQQGVKQHLALQSQTSAAEEQSLAESMKSPYEASADTLAGRLRVEQQELHDTRSAMAELWALLAVPEQPAATAAAPVVLQTSANAQISPPRTSSFGVGTDALDRHTTSINLDLEALRAAERSHAEARLRAVVDEVKDRALRDVTERMSLTSQRGAFARQQSTGFADDIQRQAPQVQQQLDSMQPMQHFASKSAVSDIVSHLRTSSNMSNTARSSPQKSMDMRRPPKDAGHIVHASHLAFLHMGSSLTPRTPRSPSRLGAGMTPKKLMRLTSCVKLERQESSLVL